MAYARAMSLYDASATSRSRRRATRSTALEHVVGPDFTRKTTVDPPPGGGRGRPRRGRHLRRRRCRTRSRRAAPCFRSPARGRVDSSRGTSRHCRSSTRSPSGTPTSTTGAGPSRARRSTSPCARRRLSLGDAVGRHAATGDLRRLGWARRRLPSTAAAPRVPRPLPHPPLQARRAPRLDGRDLRRAAGARLRRLDRPQGPVHRHGRRQPARPRALPPRARGVPRCVARGSRAHARDRCRCSSRTPTA